VQPCGFDSPIATGPDDVHITEAERFHLFYDGRVRHKALVQAKANFNFVSLIWIENE